MPNDWTNETYPELHLHEAAYKQGRAAFFYGDKVPMVFSIPQRRIIDQRLVALRKGNASKAEYLTVQLFLSGIHLRDIYNTGSDTVPVDTEGMYAKEPTNPYKPSSLIGKEWQRGVNSAYYTNLERLQREAIKRPVRKHTVTNA